MDLFLDQITDLSSVYRKRYVFELVVFALVLVFIYRMYVPLESSGYIFTIITMVGLVLWFSMKRYNKTTIDTNEQIEYKLNRIQSVMYTYVDEQMRRIRYSDTNELLTRNVYQDNLDRMKLGALYTDIQLIRYIYDLMFVYKYNSDSFVSMVLAVNGILRIRLDLESFYVANGRLPVDTAYQVESATELMKKALNFSHTFVYKLPKNSELGPSEITSRIITKMHTLLKKHVLVIKRFAVKQNVQEGIHRGTKFTELNDNIPEGKVSNLDDINRFELYI